MKNYLQTIQELPAKAVERLRAVAASATGVMRAARDFVSGWTPDTMMAAGAGCITYGVWLVYAPAGFVVGGGFLLTAGVLAARKAKAG